MSPDPDRYAYVSADRALVDRLALSYRVGLAERLEERERLPSEELPRLVFVGYASDPEPWTKFQTSQGTKWYIGSRLTNEAELTSRARDFGRSDGDDYWS